MTETIDLEATDEGPAPQPPARSWMGRNRPILLALAIGILGVIVWSRWSSLGKPQRLRDLPFGWRPLGFRHGEMVVESGPGKYLAVPIDGGKPREILSLTPQAGGAKQGDGRLIANSVKLTDSGLVYLTDDRRQTASGNVLGMPGMGGMPSSQRIEYRKVGLQDMKGAGAVRVGGSFSLHLAPIAPTGSPVELANDLNWAEVTVAGNTLYWADSWRWEAVPARLLPRVDGKARVVPILPSISKLIRARVGAGEPVATETLNVQPGAVVAGIGGLAWTSSDMGPDGPGRTSLYYLGNDETIPHRLAAYKGSGMPVEMGGRLYWLEPVVMSFPTAITPETLLPYRLMSANHDLEGLVSEGVILLRQFVTSPLFAANRSLYLWCDGAGAEGQSPIPPPSSEGRVDRRQTKVYAVQFKPRLGLRVVAAFPAGAYSYFVDGRDVYSIVHEEHENWFDWSAAGLRPKQVSAVFRYRLPD